MAEPSAASDSDSADGGTASEEIGTTLERRRSLRAEFDERFSPDWLKRLRIERDALFESAGLNFSVAYDSLALAALGGGDRFVAASGEVSLTGNWTIAGEERGWPLNLHFRLRNRHAYGDRPPSALAGDLGAYWGVTDGFSDREFEIPEFYFKQSFQSRGLELRYGQLSMESQLDRHALRGAKQAFLNRAFSSNPAVAFPRFGAGATLHWEHRSGFDFTAGATTVQATKAGDQVDFQIGSSEFFQAIQLGHDFTGWGGDPARFQVVLWNSDAIEAEGIPKGSGAAITLEQELTKSRTQAFLRYAWADGEAADLTHLVAGGIGKTCREFDLAGVAVGAGQSSGADDGWQGVVEGFYRWQVAAELHVTPGIQVLVGDGFDGGGDLRIVPGIRGQLSF